jgi:hypothetical protein
MELAPTISRAYSFSRLIIQLISSLQLPSFCPSIYDQVSTGNLCRQRTIDQGGIRGATTLGAILQDVAGISASLSSLDCASARSLAASNPEAAQDNVENYAVRIIVQVS